MYAYTLMELWRRHPESGLFARIHDRLRVLEQSASAALAETVKPVTPVTPATATTSQTSHASHKVPVMSAVMVSYSDLSGIASCGGRLLPLRNHLSPILPFLGPLIL